jgi:hypothetical protein
VRFSLKWILAGMVYVAIAAAAFARGEWYFADMLWTLTMLAAVYSILIATFASGRRRIIAAGFLVAAAVFLGCMAFVDVNQLPTARLLMAVGGASEDGLNPNGSRAYYAGGFRTSRGIIVPGPINAWPLKVNLPDSPPRR